MKNFFAGMFATWGVAAGCCLLPFALLLFGLLALGFLALIAAVGAR